MTQYKKKQVDILISKNQVLQILYLKHIAKASYITMDRNPWNFNPYKLNNNTVQFYYYIY